MTILLCAAAVALSLIRELGPVLSELVVAGRAGSTLTDDGQAPCHDPEAGIARR